MHNAFVKDGIKYLPGNAYIKVCGYTKDMPENVIIPNEIEGLPVRSIAFNTFAGNPVLKNITIPNSIKYIHGYAFMDCVSLETVYISDSVRKIGEYAFWGCSNLKTVHLSKLKEPCSVGLFGEIDNPPEVFFRGAKEDFKNMFKFDIFKDHIAENEDGYGILTTVHCSDGDLIC